MSTTDIQYPSKHFLSAAVFSIRRHRPLKIAIDGGWRARILAREVARWLPVDETALLANGWKSPSVWCSLLMVSLHAIYYLALSANYEMRGSVQGRCVTLIFYPL